MCLFNARCLSRIEKYTVNHTKIIMLITNTSKDEKQGHRFFTLKCNCELLMKIESSYAFSASLDKACRQFGIHSQYYCQWKKQLDTVSDCILSNVRKIHSGPPGLLVPLDYLVWALWAGNGSDNMNCVEKSIWFMSNFLCQIRWHKSLIVHRWLKAQGLRYQMGTNEFQHSAAEAASAALDFMQVIRKKVS